MSAVLTLTWVVTLTTVKEVSMILTKEQIEKILQTLQEYNGDYVNIDISFDFMHEEIEGIDFDIWRDNKFFTTAVSLVKD